MLLSDEEKALAVAQEMERTKDNPDLMMDYSDIIAKAQLKSISDKIESDMPSITRYNALQYIRDLWQSIIKEIE